jgi:hypothetical protein
MPKRASSSIRLSQSPLQLSWRWARLRISRVMLEVDLRCRALHTGGVLLRLARFAIRTTLCGLVLCRSPPQRAVAREICLLLHMRRDPKTSYPRMRGRIRLPLTAINTMTRKRLSHPSQVLRGHDRGMEH